MRRSCPVTPGASSCGFRLAHRRGHAEFALACHTGEDDGILRDGDNSVLRNRVADTDAVDFATGGAQQGVFFLDGAEDSDKGHPSRRKRVGDGCEICSRGVCFFVFLLEHGASDRMFSGAR